MSLEMTRKNRDDLLDACVVHRKRIAELEAEVEHWRDIASSLNEVVERQGAEVERLTAQRDHWWELVERAKLLLPGWPPEDSP